MIKLTCNENNMKVHEATGTPQSLIAETTVILASLIDMIVEPTNLDIDAMELEGVNIFEMQMGMIDLVCEHAKELVAPFLSEALQDVEYTMDDKVEFVMMWARKVNRPDFSEFDKFRMEKHAAMMGVRIEDIYTMAKKNNY